MLTTELRSLNIQRIIEKSVSQSYMSKFKWQLYVKILLVLVQYVFSLDNFVFTDLVRRLPFELNISCTSTTAESRARICSQ